VVSRIHRVQQAAYAFGTPGSDERQLVRVGAAKIQRGDRGEKRRKK
jgi:hypothetical protein